MRFVLTVTKISSLNAGGYAKYLTGHQRARTMEAATRNGRVGDYYIGGSSTAGLADSQQHIGGLHWTGAEADRKSWGMVGEIDSVKVARLLEGVHAVDERVRVRTAGRRLDPVAIREALEAEIEARGGVDSLSVSERELVAAALDGRADGARLDRYAAGSDSIVRDLAEPLAEAGLLRGQIDAAEAGRSLRRLATWMEASGDAQGAKRVMEVRAGFVNANSQVLRDVSPATIIESLRRSKLGHVVEHLPTRAAKVNDFRVPITNSQDLTYSAPKSVSLAWVAGDATLRGKIEQAVTESADRAVEYLVRNTECVKVRRGGALRQERGHGYVGFAALHHSARNAGGSLPDPQLHVHSVVIGVKRADGKMITIDQAELMRHAREGGAYFRNELAGRLRELGFGIEQHTGNGGRYFELDGFGEEVRDAFSGRQMQLREERDAFFELHGRMPSDNEMKSIAVSTRQAKEDLSIQHLALDWADKLKKEHGIDKGEMLFIRRHGMGLQPAPEAHQIEAAIELIVNRMDEAGSTVRDRELRSIALESTAGLMTPNEATQLVATMQQRGIVIALADGRVVSSRLRHLEQRVLQHAAAPIADRSIAASTIDKGIARVEAAKGLALTSEQIDAVGVALSDAPVTIVVGLAGSGKGVAISAISESARLDGRGVLALATAGKRAQETGEQSSSAALNIQQLIVRDQGDFAVNVTVGVGSASESRRGLKPGDVIVIDEAAMVDTPRLERVLAIAAKHQARVVLVGDPEQLPAIGAGGMFDQLLKHVPSAELRDVRRTDVAFQRDAALAVRAGRAEEAVRLLSDNGALHMLHTNKHAMNRMVADWDTWRHQHAIDQSLLIVHTSNKDVDRVNELAQQRRLQAGELEGRSVQAPDRDYHLHVGEPVIFRTRPFVPTDGSDRVENGITGVVSRVDADARQVYVRVHEPTKSPRDVCVDIDQMGGSSLRLMYASHVYPAQGATLERTAELSGHHGTNKESTYVGLSRLRERHDVYVSREALGSEGSDADRLARLADRWNQQAKQAASLEHRVTRSRPIASQAVRTTHEVQLDRYDAMVATGRATPAQVEQQARRVHTSALVTPPPYLVNTLGRRPDDAALRELWDAAAKQVISYRLDTGERQPDSPWRVHEVGRPVDIERQRIVKRTVEKAQDEFTMRNPSLRFNHETRPEYKQRELRRVAIAQHKQQARAQALDARAPTPRAPQAPQRGR